MFPIQIPFCYNINIPCCFCTGAARNDRNTQTCSQFKLQGVLATYWFSAGIEDFFAADVWTLRNGFRPHQNKSRLADDGVFIEPPPPAALQHKDSNAQESEHWKCHRPQNSQAWVQRGHEAWGEKRLWHILRSRIHFTAKAGRKWKWSNGVEIGEMDIV